MNTPLEFEKIENEDYKISTFTLISLFKSKLTDLIDTEGIQLVMHDDFLQIAVPLKRQVLAEDLTDQLVKKLSWHVLHAAKSSDGKYYKVLLYSTPVQYSMILVTLDSSQHGILENMILRVFDSIEIMLYHTQMLKKDAESRKDYLVLEQENYKTTLSNFIL